MYKIKLITLKIVRMD